jgi:hypothetical protein
MTLFMFAHSQLAIGLEADARAYRAHGPIPEVE